MDSGVISIPLDIHGSAAHSNSSSRGWPLREFITDAENALIRLAAESVFSQNTAYNPLVFVGPNGTGKSRLARALVERWKLLNPNGNLLIISGANFARAYARAVHTDSVAELRQRYLAAELLLFDNLSELKTKPAAQLELATIMDGLLSREKRILLTTHSLPTCEESIARRLASRLANGLVVPVPLPGKQARREIAIRLANVHRIDCDHKTLYELADGLAVTVPRLHGAFAELATAGNDGQSLTASERVRKLLKKYQTQRQPSLKSITQRVCRYFQLKTTDVKGTSRKKAVAHARAVAMYITRSLTNLSLQQIGKHFGGRDHTTVLHACHKIEHLVNHDQLTSATICELTTELQESV